ncbi:MAG: hypothetical protein PHT07_21060 [Paludibacter sp.]|nr:hypothetical protein [Paludibacter sp.]
MSKVYIIGSKNTDLDNIRLMANTPESSEIILIDKMSDLPDGITEVFSAHKRDIPPIQEVYPIVNIPIFEPQFFPEKRKSHERPYKFHR